MQYSTFVKQILLCIQKALNFDDPLSTGCEKQFISSSHHPIFIIGPPRSGSTLLYQLLIKYGRFAYISNLMSAAPGFMILAARTLKDRQNLGEIKHSNYGYVPGIFAPSEAGAIFEKWFGKTKSSIKKKRIRNTLISLTQIYDAPFLSKNLKNNIRLPHIYNIFPEARFIYIKRNSLFNAQSILLSRRKLLGTDNKWWSVAPQGYDIILNENPFYQVVWQVFKLNEIITDFLNSYTPSYIEVNYETLTENPNKAVKNIFQKFSIPYRSDIIDHKIIKHQNRIKLTSAEWEKMVHIYELHQSLNTSINLD